MCGIAGQIGRDVHAIRQNTSVYGQMLASMARRGPDQRGIWMQGPAALLHARLTVVDPEGGRQPMELITEQEHYVLVYNGELYNTEELRAALQARGHTFAERSDTEVLLHAYAEWGEDCLHRLNGIYAFAVWCLRAQTLFLARDRCGVKPLFFAHTAQGLLFASEIKTLLCHPAVPPQVDQQGLAEVLLLGPGRTPGCGVFRNVRELCPGECAAYTLRDDRLTIRRYWQLEDHEHPDSLPQTIATVRDLVCDAAARQLVSDVPVGCFLSGGLDSSILAALADRQFAAQGKTLHTFSVGYRDNRRYFHATHFQPGPDAPYIRKMNETLHAEHHWTTLESTDLVDALYRAVEARDLPGMADIDASLLLFCAEVRKHATVVLSGECADEIFGGYPWYRDPTIREREGFPWAQSTLYRASFLRPGVLGALDLAEFVMQRYRQTLEETSVRPGLDATERRMRQMVNLNFRWFMQTLLDRKDRMSMYQSLEVRVPFCDDRIASYLYSVPWSFKDLHGQEKGLLRAAMQGVLPPEVLHRKKSPYPKTWHPAYLAAVQAALQAVVQNPEAPLHALVRTESLQALLDGADGFDRPWYGQLMNRAQTIAWFLQLNHWLVHYRVQLV